MGLNPLGECTSHHETGKGKRCESYEMRRQFNFYLVDGSVPSLDSHVPQRSMEYYPVLRTSETLPRSSRSRSPSPGVPPKTSPVTLPHGYTPLRVLVEETTVREYIGHGVSYKDLTLLSTSESHTPFFPQSGKNRR